VNVGGAINKKIASGISDAHRTKGIDQILHNLEDIQSKVFSGIPKILARACKLVIFLLSIWQ
jgi:hypothetical protein